MKTTSEIIEILKAYDTGEKIIITDKNQKYVDTIYQAYHGMHGFNFEKYDYNIKVDDTFNSMFEIENLKKKITHYISDNIVYEPAQLLLELIKILEAHDERLDEIQNKNNRK